MLAKRAAAAAATAALALTAAACGGGSGEDPGRPETAKSVTIAIAADEGTLTPYTNKRGYPGANLVRLVFDTLVILDPDNQVKPLLAEELRTSDNKVYELPLRKGVKWHDGQPFTAEDVVFSVDYYKEHVAGDTSVDMHGVKEAAAEGDTVTITLEAPDPEFPVRTLADMAILPKHLWEDVKKPTKAGKELAVGTGPYRLTEYTEDQGYTFARNGDYAMGGVAVEKIDVKVIPEDTTQFAALRTGEIQMSSRPVPEQQISQLKNTANVDVAQGVDFPATLLLFNTDRPPFDRTEVRRALAKAIDVGELVKTVLLGNGYPGDPGFVHPESPIKGEPQRHTYDPEAAKRELDAAGARPGADGIREIDGKPMSYELLVYSVSTDRLRAAEIIKEKLAEVGVEVKVKSMDPDALDAKVWPEFDVTKGRNYDMAMWGWSGPVMLDTGKVSSLVASDPGDGVFNVVGLEDEETDRIVADLKSAATMEEKLEAAKRLEARIGEVCPFVTLYYRSGAYGFRSDVFDQWTWQKGQGILHKFSFVDLDL